MFILSADDNDLYFFRNRTDVRRCPVCRQLTNKWEEDVASVPLTPPPRNDISYSYDGVLVVSPRFRATMAEGGASGLAFRPLQAGFFAARSVHTVPFDAARRKTRFEKRCGVCGEFESVVGATPAFLRPGAHVPDNGFVRTDLEFGSNDEKGPVELCGDDIARRLQDANLSGLDLMTVEERRPTE
jgi:hypothetical protein